MGLGRIQEPCVHLQYCLGMKPLLLPGAELLWGCILCSKSLWKAFLHPSRGSRVVASGVLRQSPGAHEHGDLFRCST